MRLGRRLLQQLVHFFAILLWVAAGLALVGRLPALALAIVVVVVVNAVFAAVQEHRADRAAERLQQLVPRRATVRRDGRRTTVDAADVVPGDLLVLEPGDRVAADAQVVSGRDLRIDASTLTGESEPVPASRDDTAFAGTMVVGGTAEAVVTATGPATRLAAIALLTTTTVRPRTPLALELRRVVRLIAVIAVTVGTVFFAVSLLLGNGASKGFIFAVGVTVALVPEALLPTVTLSLSMGAERMAGRRVLVRNLEAVETLGSTTFVCTDKTGTLTLNEMSVVEVWTPRATASVDAGGYDPSTPVELPEGAREPVTGLAASAAECSFGFAESTEDLWRAHGDPMEAAIDVFARRLGIDTHRGRASHQRWDAVFPFDPVRRTMSVVVDGTVIVKGAPDAVLPLCAPVAGATAAMDRFAVRGLRVLAVATRPVDAVSPGASGAVPQGASGAVPSAAADAERDLQLLGLLGLEDPPRDDVADAIASCRRAGVRVAMVTGDHPSTAAAIASETGLRGPDGLVLAGDELPDDLDELGALLDAEGVVVARVSPEQKLMIAAALRRRGHVVAMTGDGVNDGPALTEADIGIAMGRSGTDVAREAADLVLLDDHFGSIVDGIEQGRSTYLNIRRFLTYHLTDNVAELAPFLVWALSRGRIPLALGVLQILAIDIGTDTLSAVALGAERPGRHVLDRPPVTGRLMNRTVLVRAFALLGPSIAVVSMAAFLTSLSTSGWDGGTDATPGALAAASGATFVAIVAGQAANAFACRSSTRWPGALGWRTNPLLLLGVGVGVGLSVLTLVVPPVARALGQAWPTWWGWLVVAVAPASLLAVDATWKAWRRRTGRPRAAREATRGEAS